ncbi:hypothetical protein [Haloferula sp.]|uniref:hypothetical protein n=1 Tax=Haloferula sp. TaxID=2497595 RepID=UPI003C752ACD
MQLIFNRESSIARILPFLLAWSIGVTAFGQVRGSVETFDNEPNAMSWFVYDFGDGMFYSPGWDVFMDGDPDLFTIVEPGSGVSLLADVTSSRGELVGDFSGNRIAGMGCEAFVEDAAGLDYAEFYFVSDGVFYFSLEFGGLETFGSDDWVFITVDFKEDPWYLLGDEGFTEVELTDEILSSVTEVGVDFFANDARTESMLVAIDDFVLFPETILPELGVARTGSDFVLSFVREVSQEYKVMKSPDLKDWKDLEGHSEITGDSIYTVTDPLAGKAFYQVETDFFLTIIPDVDPP